MSVILIASHNSGKIEEIRFLLSDLPFKLLSQNELDLDPIAETGSTFAENAALKARYAAQQSGYPTIADDSGLSIDALNGAPGICSSRYAGEQATDFDRIQKVLTELAGVPDERRTAHYHCAIAWVQDPTKPEPILFESSWSGRILHESHGHQGFGYDPIFYIPSHRCSVAELDPYIKNKISHRAMALRQFRQHLVHFA